MALNKNAIARVLARFQSDLLNVQSTLKDRGSKYFQRPLLLGGIMIFAAYFYVYSAAGKMSVRIDRAYGAAQATVEHAEEYENLKIRLDTIRRKLPRTKNPGNWLLQAVRATLKEEGIVPLSTSPPEEVSQRGYRFITIKVRFQSNYRQIASWVSRLERNKKLMYIQQMRLIKEPRLLGENEVEIQVTTVVSAEEGSL